MRLAVEAKPRRAMKGKAMHTIGRKGRADNDQNAVQATGSARDGQRYVNTPRHLRRSLAFPIPAPWPEIRTVAAMLDHPAALARFDEHDLLPSDFQSEFAGEFVAALLHGGDMPEILAQRFTQFSPNGVFPWRACVETSRRLGNEWGTASEAGAFKAIDAFAAQVKSGLLANSLRWAAERVACDEYAPKDRHELDRLFDAAGIGGETAA